MSVFKYYKDLKFKMERLFKLREEIAIEILFTKLELIESKKKMTFNQKI